MTARVLRQESPPVNRRWSTRLVVKPTWLILLATGTLTGGDARAQAIGRTTAQVPARNATLETSTTSAPDTIEPLDLQPLHEKTAGDVDRLIPLLAAVDYHVRQEATARLIEIGAPAFSKLREAYRYSDDLEVRLRLERIVHTSYLDYHVYSQKGFLGISLLTYRPTGKDDPPIPDSTPAVRITRVIEGTAADRGGIEAGDVVVAMEGKPLTLERTARADRTLRSVGPVVDGFSRRIAAHRPGDRLTITLYRGQTRRDVEVRLGRWSQELRRQGNVVAIDEALVVARDRFHGWWNHHFHTPPEGD